MYKIDKHPILPIPEREEVTFRYNGKEVKATKGISIAAALHQAGFPIHSHSISGRERSVQCGIGKCGACEMLVDGKIVRACSVLIDDVKEVYELPKDYQPENTPASTTSTPFKVYKTSVAIVGAGPAGLAAREILIQNNIGNIVIDNHNDIGGQFVMQTHQFFFFEETKKYGGMRGFDIAKTLAGNDYDGIILQSVVWDIFEGKRLAIKNLHTGEISFVEADYLIIATGAIPFVPSFENDDLPGVYTAAVVQKMMNTEYTLLGKNILTIGAGNIGYLTSYQAMQAGANVKAIIEGMSHEGGFPVQANRVRRLGIPILTSHILLKAIPNKNHDGITGAIIAKCENFKPIAGTERLIDGIDTINVCTGLLPDNRLMAKGNTVFGKACVGAGDVLRIGEGTSAVLRGKQAAYEIMQMMNVRFNYDDFLKLSRDYIDSQQRPVRILNEPNLPSAERMEQKPFVVANCLYGFACNPCTFACPMGAITKSSTSSVPVIDYDKCIGCMKCVNQCPGLAIFGYNFDKNIVYLPYEFNIEENTEVYLVDNNGGIVGEGYVLKVVLGRDKTNVIHVKATNISGDELLQAHAFIVKDKYPKPIKLKNFKDEEEGKSYVCFCEDIDIEKVMLLVGNRKSITIQEIKHNTRIGMGTCRGTRCFPRLRQLLSARGVELINAPTPRAPMGSQISLGDLMPKGQNDQYIINEKEITKVRAKVLIAGGGMAGSSVFRYFSEANLNPILINNETGSSWACIAGGRPSFSIPEIADIAKHNHELFKELQKLSNIDYHPIQYVNFAHDEETYNNLIQSMEWSDAYMIKPEDYAKEISPFINPDLKKTYFAAQISNNCWQATPGKTINLLRNIGISKGGVVKENCKLIDVKKDGDLFVAIVQDIDKKYIEYTVDHFVNALGPNADAFAKKLDINTGLYPIKHQAFITRKLPMLGVNGNQLNMLIDRRNYKNYIAVYGQQLRETGQVIICASPAIDAQQANKDLKVNTKDFFEVANEVFVNWIPNLANVSLQSAWSGYYTEPRMIVDHECGLIVGLKGHGFMLSQYLAKNYVDAYLGKQIPEYFSRLKLNGDGMKENAFK